MGVSMVEGVTVVEVNGFSTVQIPRFMRSVP